MTERRVLLDAAAYMDSGHAHISGTTTEDVRTVTQRFLTACYTGVGKPPKSLDGDDMLAVLCEHMPRHFGTKDKLAAITEDVLTSYLVFLSEAEVVHFSFEQKLALAKHASTFRDLVASGAAHSEGILHGRGKTIQHAAEKTGRNDPCPCGSGRKFKKCCMRLGD